MRRWRREKKIRKRRMESIKRRRNREEGRR